MLGDLLHRFHVCLCLQRMPQRSCQESRKACPILHNGPTAFFGVRLNELLLQCVQQRLLVCRLRLTDPQLQKIELNCRPCKARSSSSASMAAEVAYKNFRCRNLKPICAHMHYTRLYRNSAARPPECCAVTAWKCASNKFNIALRLAALFPRKQSPQIYSATFYSVYTTKELIRRQHILVASSFC